MSRVSDLLNCLEFQVGLGVKFSCLDLLEDGESVVSLDSLLKSIDGPADAALAAPTLDNSGALKQVDSKSYSSAAVAAGAAVAAVVAARPASRFADLASAAPTASAGKVDLQKIARIRGELEGVDSLDGLRNYVLNFKECALKMGAQNTVFSDGNPSAKVMLIGEAPGEQEDLQGIPFCGKSGMLLDEVLSSIGLFRKDNLYISNSVFWRPPANRKPTEEEIATCLPILEKHIAIVKPQLIILCGATAMEAVMNLTGITKMVGEFLDYTNCYLEKPIKAVPIFHPAFLLRSPMSKAVVWKNMLAIKAFLVALGVL